MDDLEITIKLPLSQLNLLLNVIGELPTKTGVWPIAEEIRLQGQKQVDAVKQDVAEPVTG